MRFVFHNTSQEDGILDQHNQLPASYSAASGV